MPFAGTGRIAGVLLGALTLTLSAPARAGDKPLSSGIMIPFNSGSVTTTCSLLNVGAKPITIVSTAVYTGPAGETVAASDDCTQDPVPAMTACSFGGGSGVYGGGIAFVKGSPKNLRGNCRLTDEAGIVLQILPMR
jgi:hypothetical protein